MTHRSDGTSSSTLLTPNHSVAHGQSSPAGMAGLAWIQVAPAAPYFVTDTGENWTPIGQNDAITWPELAGAFRRQDLPGVARYLAWLAAHGVTCLRLMLEYCHTENRYLERPVGCFQPHLIRWWDDIFALCEQYGLRLLLTPYDTFWMRRRWAKHPYRRANGGTCQYPSQWLTCSDTRAAVKARLTFATQRWGGSGVLFAWDLWNEIDPAHAGHQCGPLHDWVNDISQYLRQLEISTHGRAHLQTVSVYSPVLKKYPALADTIFRHPALDFASVHLYDTAIRLPTDTIKPAVQTAALTQQALREIEDGRPFLDSEHGPDRQFRRRHGTLPEVFDDQYFRHVQWAHLASGGAGGGFRWPYRHPHTLTQGMRQAQQVLASFAQQIHWKNFPRKNRTADLQLMPRSVKGWACGTDTHLLVWLLRTDTRLPDGTVNSHAQPIRVRLKIPAMQAGSYSIRLFDTLTGTWQALEPLITTSNGTLTVQLPSLVNDRAMLISRQG